jgi:hypothetical protein
MEAVCESANWSEAELRGFLEEKRLYRLLPIFWPNYTANKSSNNGRTTAASSTTASPTQSGRQLSLEMLMFEKSGQHHTLQLCKAPLDCLIDLLLLPQRGMRRRMMMMISIFTYLFYFYVFRFLFLRFDNFHSLIFLLTASAD